MGKYNTYDRKPASQKPAWKIHPIWQGIGCLMAIIIPIMSYAGAVLLVQANLTQRWLPVPRELAQSVALPLIGRVPFLFANLIVTVLLMIIGFGAMTILYTLVYKVVGPPRYGPLDSPPVRDRPRPRR